MLLCRFGKPFRTVLAHPQHLVVVLILGVWHCLSSRITAQQRDTTQSHDLPSNTTPCSQSHLLASHSFSQTHVSEFSGPMIWAVVAYAPGPLRPSAHAEAAPVRAIMAGPVAGPVEKDLLWSTLEKSFAQALQKPWYLQQRLITHRADMNSHNSNSATKNPAHGHVATVNYSKARVQLWDDTALDDRNAPEPRKLGRRGTRHTKAFCSQSAEARLCLFLRTPIETTCGALLAFRLHAAAPNTFASCASTAEAIAV